MLVLGSTLQAGCLTLKRGQRLEEQVAELQQQQKKLDSATEADRAEFSNMLERAQKDVNQIREVLNHAAELMQRNSADFGADFARYQEEFAKVRGQVETLQFNLEKTQKDLLLFKEDVDLRFGGGGSATIGGGAMESGGMGTSPEAMLQAGRQAHKKGNFTQAEEILGAYLATFPEDKGTAEGLYLSGESLMQLGKPKDAGRRFEQIVSKHGKSDYIDDAFYKLGDVFVALGSCANAKKFYERVVKGYKGSPLVADAKEKISDINSKKLCKSN